MERYISANGFIRNLKQYIDYEAPVKAFGLEKELIELVNNELTADVQPVVHAYWIDTENGNHFKCSVCGWRAPVQLDEMEEWTEFLTNFCPGCGAKMDEEKET